MNRPQMKPTRTGDIGSPDTNPPVKPSPKTVEELMRPRVELVADWPGNHTLVVGDILTIYEDGKNAPLFVSSHGDKYGLTFDPTQYPHLFRMLEWWEERKPEDMPEYLIMKHQIQEVKKVFEHFVLTEHGWGFIDQNERRKSYVNYLPATVDQYNDFIKSKEHQTKHNG